VPASPINTVEQAFADPQIVSRQMRVDASGVPGIRTPIMFGEDAASSGRTAPALHEHDEAVRKALENGEWPA
jgi:crotonobetainyl-CoA:carnitine CoA-transferase CaiB-like acyl-CoA transferase